MPETHSHRGCTTDCSCHVTLTLSAAGLRHAKRQCSQLRQLWTTFPYTSKTRELRLSARASSDNGHSMRSRLGQPPDCLASALREERRKKRGCGGSPAGPELAGQSAALEHCMRATGSLVAVTSDRPGGFAGIRGIPADGKLSDGICISIRCVTGACCFHQITRLHRQHVNTLERTISWHQARKPVGWSVGVPLGSARGQPRSRPTALLPPRLALRYSYVPTYSPTTNSTSSDLSWRDVCAPLQGTPPTSNPCRTTNRLPGM